MRGDRRSLYLLVSVALLCACVDPDERGPDAENLRDPWSLAAVPADPSRAAGRRIFDSCASCHLSDGSGRPDGTIPRLAGQHAEILERRLQGVADGSIDLPVMTPFARALTSAEMRQVSAYLASLPRPLPVGTGAAEGSERGPEIFGALCSACHGPEGRGRPELFAPRLCGQHDAYLLRRLNEAVAANVRVGDPTMRAIVSGLSVEDRRAVSSHLARSECD